MPKLLSSPLLLQPRSLISTRSLNLNLARSLFMSTSTSTSKPASSPPPRLSPPPNAWDSHMHVTDPATFPPAASAVYAPHAALLADALANARAIGVPNLVFVQPSTYGFDNACLLDGLRRVGPAHGRGVVVVDIDASSADDTTPTTASGSASSSASSRQQEELRSWHALGVRGLRVNLKSVGRTLSREEMADVLRRHADLVRPLGANWVLQVYADLEGLRGLAELMPELGVKVVVDHLGSPPPEIFDDEARAGSGAWADFVRFLGTEGAYTKVSGPYRLTKDPEFRDLEGIVREVMAIRGGRAVVFASDWPHTRFEGINIEPWVQRCLEWCGEDEMLKDRLFRDNAKELWDVE